MGSFFTGLLAFIKAIPALYSLVSKFVAWWIEREYAQMKEDNREAIRKAVITHDQRPIEVVIGSPTAGKPIGVPGSIIVDEPPR